MGQKNTQTEKYSLSSFCSNRYLFTRNTSLDWDMSSLWHSSHITIQASLGSQSKLMGQSLQMDRWRKSSTSTSLHLEPLEPADKKCCHIKWSLIGWVSPQNLMFVVYLYWVTRYGYVCFFIGPLGNPGSNLWVRVSVRLPDCLYVIMLRLNWYDSDWKDHLNMV